MTLAEAEQQLADWEAALAAAQRGKSYTIEGRSLTRQDLGDIRETIDWLEAKVARLTRAAQGGTGVRYVG